MLINRKFLLIVAIAGMTIVGVIFLSIPFFQSLSMNAKQENDAWGAVCDVSDLALGGMKKCGLATVYRRTSIDKKSIARFKHLLADPASSESKQPESTRNQWRSENKDFFVFSPWAPVRGCGVELKDPEKSFERGPEEKEALLTLPYFTENCEGRTWDTSGRLYLRTYNPPEKNLIVPRVRWVSESSLLIYGS